MKNKITLLTKNYPPQIGGIEKYSQQLYYSLLKEGHEVFLIKAWPRNQFLLSRSKNSLVWLILYIYSELFRLSFFALRAFTFGFYYAYKSDIIWSLDGSISWIGFILGKAPFSSKKVTKVTLHALDVVWDNWIYQKIMPWFWKHSSEVICLNIKIKQILLGKWLKNITLIPHSLKSLHFDNPGKFDRILFLNKYGIPTNKILLFSLGRFVEKKGFHWFLWEVLSYLDSSRYHFVLAWGGPMESEYRKIISKKIISNITLTGTIVDPIEKAKMLLSMHYFLMPTVLVFGDCEWFPMTLLEAKYYWLPVILSDNLSDLEYEYSNNCTYLPMKPEKWIDFFDHISWKTQV